MDDAVLSSGSHILNLLNTKKGVQIITVFTSFGSRPISWDAQKYLMKSGFFRLDSFTKARKNEDLNSMHMLDIPFVQLDFIDGGFRKDSKEKFFYPTFDHLCSGKVPHEDVRLIQTIKKTLNSSLHSRNWNFINSGNVLPGIQPSDILYAPLGIGNHADHIIVNRVAQTLPNKTYYWLDQPYAWKAKINQQHGYKEAFRVPHQKKKEEVLSCYRSQMWQLYPHWIPKIDEVFFEKKSTR
jgi:LmbE family N-acetylglucosaminyl deacetylase